MQATEYTFIKRQILNLTKVDLNCYKTPQMQRRLRTYLLRSGHADWSSYFRDAQDDSTELSKLKDYLTINVSSFFRDPAKYQHLQDVILSNLTRGQPRLRVWSAGCSRGQEAYTLAIILADMTGPFRKHYILASDLDNSAIAHAKAGGPYTADDVANVPPTLLSRYFRVRDEKYWVTDDVRSRITFRQHNLLNDPFESGFDLIVCRNVVIYFTGEVKDKLYQRFFNALRVGGVLFVGGTEIVPKATDIGFKTAGISFYRREGKA